MRKISRVLQLILVVAMLVSVFVGCGNEAKAPAADTVAKEESSKETQPEEIQKKNVTLRFSWWGGDARHNATLEAIKLYTDKNPNIKIDGEFGGFDGYREKLATQLVAGNQPDIMQIDAPWLSDLSKMNDPFIDFYQSTSINISGFDQELLKGYGDVGGKLYGLPTGINANALTLYSELAQSVGVQTEQEWDWNKLITEGKKYQSKDKKHYMFAFEQNNLVDFVLRPYIIQKTGKQLVQDDYTLGFDKAVAAEAFTYMMQLFDEGVTQPAGEAFLFKGKDNPKWAAGEIGGFINWLSVYSTSQKTLGGKELSAYLPPIMSDAVNSGWQVRPSQLITVSTKSADSEEAIKFLDFFFNDKDAVLTLNDARGVPPIEASRKILGDANKLDPVVVKATSESAKKAGLVYNAPSNNEELRNILMDVLEKVAFKNMTPDQGADDLIKRYEDKLKVIKDADTKK